MAGGRITGAVKQSWLPDMARPTKLELLQRFFPEVLDSTGSKGDKEAALKVNTLACEAVLADLLNLYDKGLARLGPGALCLRLQRDAQESSYISREDFEADRAMAHDAGLAELETFLADVITQVDQTNPEKAALILLLDNSNAQLFPLDRSYPARSIQAMMEEYAA